MYNIRDFPWSNFDPPKGEIPKKATARRSRVVASPGTAPTIFQLQAPHSSLFFPLSLIIICTYLLINPHLPFASSWPSNSRLMTGEMISTEQVFNLIHPYYRPVIDPEKNNILFHAQTLKSILSGYVFKITTKRIYHASDTPRKETKTDSPDWQTALVGASFFGASMLTLFFFVLDCVLC